MSDLSTAPPARLFTASGTVVYIDVASGELRHGPIATSPLNAVIVRDPGSPPVCQRGAIIAEGHLRAVTCTATRSWLSSNSEAGEPSFTSATFQLVPLERGILGLKSNGLYLSAEPNGLVTLSRAKCSLWECFLASEDWCTTAPATIDSGNLPEASADWREINRLIIDPMLRLRSRNSIRAKKVFFFANTEWSNGRVYYDLCKCLHRKGYIADILNWRVSYTREQMHEMLAFYDFVISGLDGIPGLIDNYKVPCDKIIGISHGVYYDFHLLIEKKGLDVFERLANFGVVSYSMISESAIVGVSRIPVVASLGVNYSAFSRKIPERLATVGYASSISHKTKYGVEKKRGELALECAEEAGLAYRPAGTHAIPISFHDMPGYYETVDAVLMTSLIEAAGLPVLEAAAAGRLVIGTPVGHFPLRAYQGGGIIAPIQAEKFKRFTAATLRYYKENSAAFVDKCNSIQNAARNFDWEYIIDEWIELIETARPKGV
jgi:hypothetical protein